MRQHIYYDDTTCVFLLSRILIVGLLVLIGCSGSIPTEESGEIDLTPFIEQARNSSCADLQNRLFLIDRQLVLWDQLGSCVDASYAQTLYRNNLDEVLCENRDSIAGPQKWYYDSNYKDLFDTILSNLDKEDLGLGSDHEVQEITF
jgi:hypothetical protein